MKMLFFSLALCLMVCGCDSLPKIFGKSSQSVAKQEQRIERLDDKVASVQKKKLEDIGILATGTDYSLSKITNNIPRAVIVARDMNQRVISEAGYSPSIEQFKSMQKLIDDLIATNQAGALELQKRDKRIEYLLDEEKNLREAKQQEIARLNTLAKEIAGESDATKNELGKYTAYWGLGGIWLGTMQLAKNLMWFAIIGTVLFIILRVLAFSNPIAAIVFGIFQSIAASVIHLIEMAIPQSIATIDATKKELNTVAKAVNTALNEKT